MPAAGRNSLEEALDLFEGSKVARDMLGEDFVEHYVLMNGSNGEVP